ncbi:hypothetical protein D3C80_1463850 [compost metagenome]
MIAQVELEAAGFGQDFKAGSDQIIEVLGYERTVGGGGVEGQHQRRDLLPGEPEGGAFAKAEGVQQQGDIHGRDVCGSGGPADVEAHF